MFQGHVGPGTEEAAPESSVLCTLYSGETVPRPAPPLSPLTSNELKLLRAGKSPSPACRLSSCPLVPPPWALPPRLETVLSKGANGLPCLEQGHFPVPIASTRTASHPNFGTR